MVVVGEPPSSATGYAASAAQAARRDAVLRRIIAQLLAIPHVRRVAGESGVVAALAELGVAPDATSSAPGLRSVHRDLGGAQLYYLQNASQDVVSATVTLAGPRRSVPYLYDAWTGSIDRVAEYTAAEDAIRTSVRLAPGDVRIIAIKPARSAGAHVTQTTADAVRFRDGRLVLRAGQPGTYTATLSDGREVGAAIATVPAAIGLATWDLSVDEWRPGPAGSPSSRTEHVSWSFDEIALTPWSDLAEIADAVGVGTYTATLEWTGARHGAYLDLGRVAGAFRVSVNGDRIGPVDQLDTRVDLGRRLRAGTNTIRVEVATSLLNRLRTHRPAEFGSRPKQAYGLLGPVTLVPYGEAVPAG